MDARAPNKTFALKVNVNCCETCPSKLRQRLLEVDGVYSVSIDTGKNLICITGQADPVLVVKMIAKMGKSAQLTPDNPTVQEGPKTNDPSDNMEHHYCCHEDFDTYHQCEDYAPPLPRGCEDCHRCEEFAALPMDFGADGCRDRYCRIHNLYRGMRGPREFSQYQHDSCRFFGASHGYECHTTGSHYQPTGYNCYCPSTAQPPHGFHAKPRSF